MMKNLLNSEWKFVGYGFSAFIGVSIASLIVNPDKSYIYGIYGAITAFFIMVLFNIFYVIYRRKKKKNEKQEL